MHSLVLKSSGGDRFVHVLRPAIRTLLSPKYITSLHAAPMQNLVLPESLAALAAARISVDFIIGVAFTGVWYFEDFKATYLYPTHRKDEINQTNYKPDCNIYNLLCSLQF